jgi:hypothetical protein
VFTGRTMARCVIRLYLGFLQIYWSTTGVSGVYGPLWKNVVTGIPSSIVGACVGIKTTVWATEQIMKGSPRPGKATLRGALYGALDGAIILASSLIPLLIIGHYAGTIHFNLSDDYIVLKLLGSAMLGGTLYGGSIGLAVGALYGPCISIYLRL